jgi:hypothetical protein
VKLIISPGLQGASMEKAAQGARGDPIAPAS